MASIESTHNASPRYWRRWWQVAGMLAFIWALTVVIHHWHLLHSPFDTYIPEPFEVVTSCAPSLYVSLRDDRASRWMMLDWVVTRLAYLTLLLSAALLVSALANWVRALQLKLLSRIGAVALGWTALVGFAAAIVGLAEAVGRTQFGMYYGPAETCALAPLGPDLWISSDYAYGGVMLVGTVFVVVALLPRRCAS